MRANLIRYENERQRQARREKLMIDRAKQERRNRIEWSRRAYEALLAGNMLVANHIISTQLKGQLPR